MLLNYFQEHDAPCAVCRVALQGTMLMIPAKTTCPTYWTEEYIYPVPVTGGKKKNMINNFKPRELNQNINREDAQC